MMQEARLRLYIYICSQRISFLFVSLSVPWRQSPDHPTASLHQSLQCKAAGQLSVRGFLYLPMAWFYEVHMEVVHSPLVGSEPPGVLALVPICCSTNPPVLASRWATTLWLTDLAVCREGLTRRHSNWFILLPWLTTLRSLIGQACQGGGRARGYGMGYCPGGIGSVSIATSQLKENPNQIFKKTNLCRPMLKVNFLLFSFISDCQIITHEGEAEIKIRHFPKMLTCKICTWLSIFFHSYRFWGFDPSIELWLWFLLFCSKCNTIYIYDALGSFICLQSNQLNK